MGPGTDGTGTPILFRVHAFAWACEQNFIERRLTRPKHPWTNGQVERMNRTLKEATVKRYYYQTHQQFKEHLQTFLMAYNFAKRLETLRGLTPYQFICQSWQKNPLRFTINPLQHIVGLYGVSINLHKLSTQLLPVEDETLLS